VPTARASRTISASPDDLWDLIGDPHHLPRWWPRVTRVEDVDADAFTEVFSTRKGKLVRADFDLVLKDDCEHVLRWAQRVQGTPFERVLRAAETEVRLTRAAATQEQAGADATEVTIELRQVLGGVFARLGSVMVRRAASETIGEALDGLARISG